jgi:MFS family permease
MAGCELSLILSFLVSFGIVKAFANLFAGRLSDRIGRKHILVAGWLAGVPVPLLLIAAPRMGLPHSGTWPSGHVPTKFNSCNCCWSCSKS